MYRPLRKRLWVKCRHKPTVGKSYTVLYHNLSTRLRANKATETNEKNYGNQISSISSMILDRDCLIILKKSLARNWMNRMLSPFTLTRPTLMRTLLPIGLTIMGTQIPQSKITVAKVSIIQMQIKFLQQGTLQKDKDSSIGELFRSRERHSSKDDDEPPLKMSREILFKLTMTWVYKRLRARLSMNS